MRKELIVGHEYLLSELPYGSIVQAGRCVYIYYKPNSREDDLVVAIGLSTDDSELRGFGMSTTHKFTYLGDGAKVFEALTKKALEEYPA